MQSYRIKKAVLQFDETKTYMNFYRQNGQGRLFTIDLERMLGSIQSGIVPVDDSLKDHFTALQRWETEAPRKRALREGRQRGFTILTTDELFEEEGGKKIIDNLENTGVFASYFLREVYTPNKSSWRDYVPFLN